jgi:hypothetical protein
MSRKPLIATFMCLLEGACKCIANMCCADTEGKEKLKKKIK